MICTASVLTHPFQILIFISKMDNEMIHKQRLNKTNKLKMRYYKYLLFPQLIIKFYEAKTKRIFH